MTMTEPVHDIIRSLRNAITDCSRRGLYVSSKWAAEQLSGFSKEDRNAVPLTSTSILPLEGNCDAELHDYYSLAKGYFDCKEYFRAAQALTGYEANPGPVCQFLGLYSLFLVTEGAEHINDDSTAKIPVDEQCQQRYTMIESKLSTEYTEDKLDGFLLYLYALVSLKLKRRSVAFDALIRSINKYPYNWAAWLELSNTIQQSDELSQIMEKVPSCFAASLFCIYAGNESNQGLDAIGGIIDEMQSICPTSPFLHTQRAVLHHNVRDFDEAEICFQALTKSHPYMLEYMDIYSNVLYVKEKHVALSDLAQRATCIDKYRHETCIIIGNYYSLKGEREKAIQHFQRALKLNHRYSAAWTLTGHEYVELRNPQAAIEVYRKAVDLNPRDYRAWFGLAQAYDLLRLPLYSLNYYQKAVSIRPYDGRMWNALGACFATLDRPKEAIKCLKRALNGSDIVEPFVYARIAALYLKMVEASIEPDGSTGASALDHATEQAARFYAKYISEHERLIEISSGEHLEEAAVFLIKYHKENNQVKEASKYLHFISHTREGKLFMQELKS